MTYTTASAIGVTYFDARSFPTSSRRSFNGLTVGIIAMAAAWLIIASVVVAATWMMAASLTAHFDVRASISTMAKIAPLADAYGKPPSAEESFEPSEPPGVLIERDFRDLFPALQAARDPVSAAPPTAEMPLLAELEANGLPPAKTPAKDEIAPAAVKPPAAQPAAATRLPPMAVAKPRARSEEARNAPIALPAPDGRTAIYDIASHTVYLPNGSKLEAHSGLGSKLDDPRYVNVKNRGATPPNTYDLTLREDLFHGVQAIRLNPSDGSKMFGRDGILAHSYMLGPSGQSNGCVSFSNYPAFLRAFLKGEVNRLVVVARLAPPPRRPTLAGQSPPSRMRSMVAERRQDPRS